MSLNYFFVSKSKLLQSIKHFRISQPLNKSAKYKPIKLYHTLQCNNCLLKVNRLKFTNSYRNPNRYQNTTLFIKRFTVTNQSNHIKNKFKKSEIIRLLELAKPEKWKILGAVCLLVVSSGVTMAVPYSLGKVLDIIYSSVENPSESASKLNKVCAILVTVFLIGAICNFGRVYILSCAGYRVTQNLRKRVFSAVMHQEQSWFDRRSTGELINRLSSDTQLVGQALSSNLSDGLRSTFSVLAGSGMMVYTSPELAMIGLSVIPPIAMLAVVYGRFVRNITRRVQDGLADGTTLAEERISNIRTVRMFAQEEREMKNYGNRMDLVLDLGYKESLARAFFYGAAGLTGNTVVVGVLYYGGFMVAEHQSISVGALSAFLMYAAYIGVSVGGLTRFYTEMNRSIGAATRLWELIDRKPAIPIQGGLKPKLPPTGRVTFENVKFGYNNNFPVLEDFKLDIQPGQTVAVVGASGSGKSTLGALLLRLYEPNSGSVLLDGINVNTLDPLWLRTNIGAVAQEPILFAGTIRENILYGADSPDLVTDVQLKDAITESNLCEFITKLPNGLDTMVGERGLTLSGGQRQRIAIARALIKQPNILILDEATSALDAKSEHLVREALERAAKGRTVLTIAHRLSTIRNANTIAVLQDGKIVETGTYDELLAKPNGKFRELVMHQTFKDVT